MTESEIRALWKQLQEKLGRKVIGQSLESKGWDFKFSRAKKAIGHTEHPRRSIALSRVLIQNGLSENIIDDTIRHEISHALDYEIRGTTDHGPEWKDLARRCGADPERTSDLPEEVPPAYRWHRWCPECEAVVGKYYRRPTSDRYVCRECRSELDIVKAPAHPDA